MKFNIKNLVLYCEVIFILLMCYIMNSFQAESEKSIKKNKKNQEKDTVKSVKIKCFEEKDLLSVNSTSNSNNISSFQAKDFEKEEPRLKYLLIWTPRKEPLSNLKDGQQTFISRNCLFNNCFVTWNRTLLTQITDYDAILFDGYEISHAKYLRLPKKRSEKQLYIFVSKESSVENPVNDLKYDSFFNVTWTYRLDSDLYFGYIIIKDKTDNVVGPKRIMQWADLNQTVPIRDVFERYIVKVELGQKDTAAAWFADNRIPGKGKFKFFRIKKELKKFGHKIDIYVDCANERFPLNVRKMCLEKIWGKYYFYFAFEHLFSKDFVTDKLLIALKNYAIPVVYGGADYNKFMPKGIYLDAKKHSYKKIAKRIDSLIRQKELYDNYFKWKSFYSFHHPEEDRNTDPYCKLCEYMNNAKYGTKIIENFLHWWNK